MDSRMLKKRNLNKILMIIAGNVLYASGVNLAINPIHLYSGGFTGISQLIRTFLLDFLHMPQPSGFDIMGVIYFLLNVPCFLMAYKIMGKKFTFATLVSNLMASAFLMLIPIPVQPIVHDRMLSAIIGGIGSGVGAGLVLRAGSSQGGQDVIGVCLAKTHPNFKVGTIGIIISVCIYTICLFIYDVDTVLYSVIFAVVTGLCVDKVHIQNIQLEAMIFTKHDGVAEEIMKELKRGVTAWDGVGAYTNEDSHVLITVISKYEEPLLKEVLARIDPHAFIIVSDNTRVIGNFEKRFTD